MQKQQLYKKDNCVSMTKGVAIVLMVLAHAHFSHLGGVVINMFHMPLFFLMSGYCFKASNLCDFKGYTWKRIKGAYWPFVKWGMVFLLLHNFLYAINIYNGDYGFRGEVSQIYTLKDIFKHTVLIVLSMNLAEPLLGGYWFLHSYFFASFIAFAVIWICRKRLSATLAGGCMLLIIGMLLKYFDAGIPYYIKAKELMAASFIVLGFSYRNREP